MHPDTIRALGKLRAEDMRRTASIRAVPAGSLRRAFGRRLVAAGVRLIGVPHPDTVHIDLRRA